MESRSVTIAVSTISELLQSLSAATSRTRALSSLGSRKELGVFVRSFLGKSVGYRRSCTLVIVVSSSRFPSVDPPATVRRSARNTSFAGGFFLPD